MMKKQKENNEISPLFKKIIVFIWVLAILPFVAIILMFILASSGILGYMPSFEELENPKSNLATEVYSADGKLLGTYYLENRSNVRYEEISPHVINALLATEDIRFTKHSGIDGIAVIRAIWGQITGLKKGGGSTITQQLAKLLFHKRSGSKVTTIIQKIKEWVIAIKLERSYSKEEIITMYLNKFDFINNAVGIKMASRVYFSTSQDCLKIEQAAMLVGMCQNPSKYNPIRFPENAKNRRNVVLSQMLKYNFITQHQYDSLKQLPLGIKFQKIDHKEGMATYLREYLRMYLTEWCKTKKKSDGTPYDIYKDGLKIYTTIDSRLQKYAEEAVTEHMKELQKQFFNHWKGKFKNAPFDNTMTDEMIEEIFIQAMKRSDRYRIYKEAGYSFDEIKKIFKQPVPMTVFSWNGEIDTILSPWDSIHYYKYYLNAGLMAMEPNTGHVKAYVGGINYKHFQYDHVMMAKRQVGSTFKPILYTLAMQEGEFKPCSKVPNVPVTFILPDGKEWTPKNADDKREGEMVTLKWGLANSVNYISAFLMKRYKPEAVVQLARKMGIKSELPPVYSLCLGTAEITLAEMVAANCCYASKGWYIEPIIIKRIEDNRGNLIEEFQPKRHEAISEETACLMLELLKGVVLSGTGARLRYKYKLEYPIAGKTGTTQNNSDGWFIGLTPSLVSGVWVGAEDRSVHFRTTNLGQGASMALPIWALFMKKAWNDPKCKLSKEDFDCYKKFNNIEFDCDKFSETDKDIDFFN